MASVPGILNIQGGGTLLRSTHVYEERALVATWTGFNPDELRGVTYEWKIGDRIVSTGTVNSYTPDDADVGKQISVTAVFPAEGSAPVRKIAGANTKLVAGINDQPTGILFFETEAAGPDTKYTAIDGIRDEDGRGPMSYQWFVNDKPIAGASGSEFILEARFAGQPVKVHGTYIDASGRSTTVVSGNRPIFLDEPGKAGIVGTIAANAELRAEVSDPNGIETIHYAWELMDQNGSWSPVAGATGPTLKLGAAPPAAVRLFVDYADGSADAQFGIANKVVVLGTNGAEAIALGGYGEEVFAAGGNDTIHHAMGGSRIDGGAGRDTYVIAQELFLLSHTTGKPNEWNVGTMDGTRFNQDVLTDVERLSYLDEQRITRYVALDVDGNAGQAFRLYQAALDRAPDQLGIGFWMHQLDVGASLKAVADAFVSSAEFRSLYGAAPTNAEIVAKFYANILDRAPDATGAAFWTEALDSGKATLADVLVAFSESGEHVASLVGTLQHGIGYLPWLIVTD